MIFGGHQEYFLRQFPLQAMIITTDLTIQIKSINLDNTFHVKRL